MGRLLGLLMLGACSDYVVRESDPVPPAEPPGSGDDDFGDAPDWEDCPGGYLGRYFNHVVNHPDFEPEGPDPSGELGELDWWDASYLSFERFDASADHGNNWWPVDDGYAGDPAYFAVQFKAWLRVFDADTVQFVLGSSDDAWLMLDEQVQIAMPGIHDFEVQTHELELSAGQYPLEVRMAHRSGESGFSFRAVGENTKVCFGEYEEEG